MATTAQKLWPTKPLDCWQRAKELRLKHYQELTNAKKDGRLFVTGSGASFVSVLAGLGDYIFLSGEPYGASVATDFDFAQQCQEATEARGFARDLCAYLRSYWGSMLLDRFLFGGPFPKPDFCYSIHFCDSHAKWYQFVKEHFGVPYFGVELPMGPEDRFEQKVEYVAGQLLDTIDAMARTIGREYDDELFIQAAKNEFRVASLWAEICAHNKTIPAPLDQKSLFTLYILAMLERHNPETVEFYETLRDEVEDRVKNGIAWLATERCRVIDDSQPPWHFLKIFRIMEQYGAVSVGSPYCFGLMGVWELDEKGSLVPARTPEERGIELRTREQTVEELARWYLMRDTGHASFINFFQPNTRNRLIPMVVREWQAQGVIMHLNRGCEGTAFGQMENRLALMNAGIPIMTYEGNMGDKREFDEAQAVDRLESFMETLGLRKLQG
ncbi:MAG: benzoyl-CoA reductase, bzd-type, subunit O [Dehalococcoidia bacterium]